MHERRRGGEPGGERDAVVGPLERGQAQLEGRPRRIGRAGVVVALVLADRFLDVGRGLVDRNRHGPGRGVRLLPVVDRARLEVHASILGMERASPAARAHDDYSNRLLDPGGRSPLIQGDDVQPGDHPYRSLVREPSSSWSDATRSFGDRSTPQ